MDKHWRNLLHYSPVYYIIVVCWNKFLFQVSSIFEHIYVYMAFNSICLANDSHSVHRCNFKKIKVKKISYMFTFTKK